MNDIFRGKGIEIYLKHDDDFLKVKETLTRIGIASKQEKTIWQSCHILHKKGRYIICHFKELFELDGKVSNISDEDISRRNAIVKLLENWNLVKVANPTLIKGSVFERNKLKIISFKDKENWYCQSKYNIGKKFY